MIKLSHMGKNNKNPDVVLENKEAGMFLTIKRNQHQFELIAYSVHWRQLVAVEDGCENMEGKKNHHLITQLKYCNVLKFQTLVASKNALDKQCRPRSDCLFLFSFSI